MDSSAKSVLRTRYLIALVVGSIPHSYALAQPVIPQSGFDQSVTASAVVEVTKANGAILTGQVDSRSDHRQLWLRNDEERVSLAVSISWDEISRAQVDGNEISRQGLAEQLLPLATTRPVSDVLLDSIELQPARHTDSIRRGVGERVSSLQIAACLANWDADAQPDGVELYVVATNRRGFSVPVRGNLQVQLLGLKQTSRHRHRPGELRRWSESVQPSHFGPSVSDGSLGARYRLPFRSLEPTSDWRLGPEAVVHARLGVYGAGSFEATTPIVLRQFSPLRDELQLTTGRRHFSAENARPLSPQSYGMRRDYSSRLRSRAGSSSFRVSD